MTSGSEHPEDAVSKAFTSCRSVQKYLESLADLTPAERASRLEILKEFCAFVGRDPDQIVHEIYDVETHKYKKRNFYSSKIKEFQEQISGSWHQRVARGNVVRSFFTANGVRVPHERAPWL